jgi:HD-GYP domain-containing protein (c-di-GMP phosphodiesterase class II)
VKLAATLGGKHAASALEQQSGSALDPDVVSATLTLLTREHGPPAHNLRDVPAA